MTLDPTNPQEGIYFNVPEPDYRRAPGYSQSQLKLCEHSMLHFRTAIDAPPTPSTAAQIDGTLIHALVLQKKELFAVIPKDAPKQPTKAQLKAKKPSEDSIFAINYWSIFRGQHPNKEFITQDEADTIHRIRDAIMADPDASEMLSRSNRFEVAGFKKHSTGLMLKGLADCLTVDDNNFTVVPDIKTCQLGGASKEAFQAAIADYGYYRQAAFYLDLFEASFFLFIAVEKEPPFAVACYLADSRMVRIGREQNERDLERIAQCELTDTWPGYPSGIQTIGLPDWKKFRTL